MRQTITTLQAGRAVAAAAVVAEHAAVLTQRRVDPLPEAWMTTLHFGAFGVDFFFVLSGFIIMHAHMDDRRDATSAMAYLRKRAARIYVPYLPIAAAIVALYTLFPGAASDPGWSLFTSLTLVAGESPPAPVLSVAWTLIHEVMFYAIFLASYFTRWFGGLVVLWMGLIATAAVLDGVVPYDALPSVVQGVLQTFLAPINVEFVAGMVAARAVRVLPPRWSPAFLCIGAASLALFLAVADAGIWRGWFGLATAFLLVGLVQRELAGGLAAPAWLVLLGNASYAIYLVHGPVISVASRLLARVDPLAVWAVSLPLCTMAGIAGGLVYYVAFEKPALRRVRLWGGGRLQLRGA
jgi:peptidoglycan/LPS O-acetylase OafA/YrhL